MSIRQFTKESNYSLDYRKNPSAIDPSRFYTLSVRTEVPGLGNPRDARPEAGVNVIGCYQHTPYLIIICKQA